MAHDLSTPGGRLRFFRSDRGMTQDSLGRTAGVDQSSISYYEANRKVPGKLVRQAIGLALGVLPSVIWTTDDLEAAAARQTSSTAPRGVAADWVGRVQGADPSASAVVVPTEAPTHPSVEEVAA